VIVAIPEKSDRPRPAVNPRNDTDPRDGEVGRVGYEINFNRYFYQYIPPRPLEEIDAEMKALEAEIAGLLKEVAG